MSHPQQALCHGSVTPSASRSNYDNGSFKGYPIQESHSGKQISIHDAHNWTRTEANGRFANRDTFRIETSIYQPPQPQSRCRCRCHSQKGEYQSPGWLRPLLGGFFLHYDSFPVLSRSCRCDLMGCGDVSSTVRFHYYFPGWLLKRVLLVSIGGSLTDFGTRLVVGRVITLHDRVWGVIRTGNLRRFRQYFAETVCRPQDYDGKALRTLLSVSKHVASIQL